MEPKDTFWNIPHHAKWDELNEERHMHLICAALSDRFTQVEIVERGTYSLYGPDEALLLRPKSCILTLGVELYRSFLSLISSTQTR